MNGKPAARRLPTRSRETISVSYADSARLLAPGVIRLVEQQGYDCLADEKLRDPGSELDDATRARIEAASIVCFVLGRRCRQPDWLQAEAAWATERGKPVLVFVEDLRIEWQPAAVPTLLTNDAARISAFLANSQPESASLWEFGKYFFIDRSTAALFERSANGGWRWERNTVFSGELSLEPEMAIVDESKSAAAEVRLVQAGVENDCPILLLGTTDWKRYRFAYSCEVRAVLPAPVYPGAPIIGFMHADFETGREWPRAGDAPVELRLLGREVYGWHMSEYFWRAFVGSLPKMLGRQTQPA